MAKHLTTSKYLFLHLTQRQNTGFSPPAAVKSRMRTAIDETCIGLTPVMVLTSSCVNER